MEISIEYEHVVKKLNKCPLINKQFVLDTHFKKRRVIKYMNSNIFKKRFKLNLKKIVLIYLFVFLIFL